MVVTHRGSRSQTLQVNSVAGGSSKLSQAPPKRRSRLARCSLCFIVVLLSLYIGVGVAIRYSGWVQQAFIYVHHVKIPFYGNLSDPSSYGLKRTRQFLLRQEDDCTIPVWQTLPMEYQSLEDGDISGNTFTTALSDGAPIVLYLHGNTGTRGTFHRVETYKFLSEEKGYHVITFDYRGFAESECYPSERGMMEDGLLVWKWIKAHTASPKLYIWGHSLGSAAATFLTQELREIGDHPSGLILDAPFTNIVDAGANHRFSAPYWPVMPLFRYLVLETFTERFESAARLKHIECPILILHGRNDIIIPYELGKQMHDEAKSWRGEEKAVFIDCEESAHKTNFQSHHTASALDKFIK